MKKLVVCCDGTWNRADQEKDEAPCPTNVVKLAYRVAKRDREVPQIVFYDQGVGTGNAVDRFSGGAFGGGLEDNIHDAYRFLVANYEPGDEVFLFGFSRGAFTARSIAGMTRKCGILKCEAIDKYPAALDLYRNSEIGPDDPHAIGFRSLHSSCGGGDVPIHFIGVWDTVGSLGIPLRGLRGLTRRKYQFHDVQLSRSVKTACHALAVDERRAPFVPTLWEPIEKPGQTIRQVWFCGAHSDVGGGYPETGLSDVALAWMLDEAAAAGLVFDAATQAAFPVRPNPLGRLHDSHKGLYDLTRPVDRTVGKAPARPGEPGDRSDPTQTLHPSVRERWDRDPSYRPASVAEYFRAIGDPRVE